jgi:hypothetical protein
MEVLLIFLPLSRTLVSFCIGLYFLITKAELLGGVDSRYGPQFSNELLHIATGFMV